MRRRVARVGTSTGAAAGAVLVLAAAAAAHAAEVTAHVVATHDSDGFDEALLHAGYAFENGLGVRVGHLGYRAPGWSATGQSLQATWRRHDAALQADAAVGVARLAGRDHAVGQLELLRPLGGERSIGLSVERGIVASRLGIDDGLTYTALALVADHAFTPRLNVGAAGGVLHFSDDNRRPFLRTRWNWSLHEPWGLHAYLKTRSLQHAERSRAYYSPARLNEAALGLSARVALADSMVLSLAADAGRQHTDAGRDATWSASVGVGSRRGAPLQWRLALLAANTAPQFAASTDYRYHSARFEIRSPL